MFLPRLRVPPGFSWLAQRLPYLIAPSLSFCMLIYALRKIFDVQAPGWSILLGFIISPFVTFWAQESLREFSDKRTATKLQAVLPPMVYDKYPFGLGSLALLMKVMKEGYPGTVINIWVKQYGYTYRTNTASTVRVTTLEPDHIKAVLATQFNSFEKGEVMRSQFNSILGTGVFNADGEMWKFHRAMTRPFFSKDRTSDFEIFGRHADDTIAQMKIRFREGYPVDFQDLVSRFTMDSATEFLFGKDLQSLSAGLPYPKANSAFPKSPEHLNNASHPANRFTRAFFDAQTATVRKIRLGRNWPLLHFWGDETKKHMRVVEDFLKPVIDDALSKKRSNSILSVGKEEKEVQEGETLLDHLVAYTEDPIILKDETMNILLAGRDTTATTLTFVIYMLSEHPSILARLREEVLAIVGPSRQPTYDDLRNMKYLRAVINETLRLYPPVPYNSRETKDPVVLPPLVPGAKPFYIPPHTPIFYSIFLVHRRTDLWGPDAMEFDPDRFLDQRLHKYLTPNPFIFLPFNGGPRICLGQQFAYNEVSYMIIRLLQSFKSISRAPEAQPLSSYPPASWANLEGRASAEKIRIKFNVTLGCDSLWVHMDEAENSG